MDKYSAADFERDMTSWDYHVGTIRGLDVSEQERDALVAGFLGIRDVLGADWLRRVWDSRCQGLTFNFINRAPWVWRELAAFGRSLATVRSRPNFDMLTSRLSKAAEYSRAMSQVRIGGYYVRAGIDIDFEPPVGNNRADLLLRASPDHYVELKTMEPSEDDKRAQESFQAVCQAVSAAMDIQYAYDGAVLKVLSKPHLKELLDAIAAALAALRAGKESVRVHEEGAYDITFCQKRLAKKETSELRGPASGGDEVRRVRRTVHNAAWQQLPADAPSILIVHDQAPEFYFLKDKPEQLVDALDEAVHEHANLMAVVVMIGWFGGGESRYVDHPKYQVFQRVTSDVLTEGGIVIKNRYSRFPFRADVLRPLAI